MSISPLPPALAEIEVIPRRPLRQIYSELFEGIRMNMSQLIKVARTDEDELLLVISDYLKQNQVLQKAEAVMANLEMEQDNTLCVPEAHADEITEEIRRAIKILADKLSTVRIEAVDPSNLSPEIKKQLPVYMEQSGYQCSICSNWGCGDRREEGSASVAEVAAKVMRRGDLFSLRKPEPAIN